MLFCKPSRKAGILHDQGIEQGQTVSIRSLKIKQDLPVIQHWEGASYWSSFWSLPCGMENIFDVFQFVQKNLESHCFVILLDEQLVCIVELCSASATDICNHISVSPYDSMIRFLMCPSLTSDAAILSTFFRWYFHFQEAGDLIADPDITAYKTCRELEAKGFVFHRNVMLAKKAASIYVMRKGRFGLLERLVVT